MRHHVGGFPPCTTSLLCEFEQPRTSFQREGCCARDLLSLFLFHPFSSEAGFISSVFAVIVPESDGFFYRWYSAGGGGRSLFSLTTHTDTDQTL